MTFKLEGKTYKVDAHCPISGKIWEIYGCYWSVFDESGHLFRHGCPKCTDGMQKHPQIRDKTYAQLYAETQNREQVFKRNGHPNYESVWECKIYEALEINKEMREFFKRVFHTQRLLPRVNF